MNQSIHRWSQLVQVAVHAAGAWPMHGLAPPARSQWLPFCGPRARINHLIISSLLRSIHQHTCRRIEVSARPHTRRTYVRVAFACTQAHSPRARGLMNGEPQSQRGDAGDRSTVRGRINFVFYPNELGAGPVIDLPRTNAYGNVLARVR